MFTALQKCTLAGLTGIFMLAATAGHEAEAAPKHSKSHPAKTATPKQAAHNNSCVQTASTAFAESQGYNSLRVMRRASALAHLRTENGHSTAIIQGMAIASKDEKVDFDLLTTISTMESKLGLEDEPLMQSSRAKGPFQYLPAPFMTLFNWFGGDYADGVYARAAKLIKFDDSKNTSTDDPTLTEQILNLRSDPYVSPYIKAVEIRKDTRPVLRAVLGREPMYSDYSIAHVMGLAQDTILIRALRRKPKAPAADVFPIEAAAADNRSLFYKGKRKLTIREFYNNLGSKTNKTLKRLDGQIERVLSENVCVTPLALNRPEPTPLNISDTLVPPTIPAPPKPDEDLPIEPDAITAPTPLPGAAQDSPPPRQQSQDPAPYDYGP